MRKARPEEKEALKRMISEAAANIFAVKQRVVILEAVVAELRRQVGDGAAPLRNPVIWQLLLDSYSMAVIDLVSLVKGMNEGGGFFNKLKNHLVQLRPGIHKEPSRDERQPDEYEQMHLKRAVADALDRLFPARNPSGCASPGDVDGLKSRLAQEVRAIEKERNRWHAHRYEENPSGELRADVKRLREHLDSIERTVNDIYLVTHATTHAFNVPMMGSLERFAQDIVDLSFIGSINDVCDAVGMSREEGDLRWYWQFRERFTKLEPGDAPLPRSPRPRRSD